MATTAEKEKKDSLVPENLEEDAGDKDEEGFESFRGFDPHSGEENDPRVEQGEGFESFRGFDPHSGEANDPRVEQGEVSQDTAPAASTSRGGVSQQDASLQSSMERECSLEEHPEVVTQVSTTCEGQLTSTTGLHDIKKKIPGLSDVILPSTPSFEDKSDSASSSDSDVHEDVSPPMQPLLRRISTTAQGRLKTRLQDLPPLTPAMKSNLTHCSSSLLHRRASLLAANELQNALPEDASVNKHSTENSQTSAPIAVTNTSGSFNKNSHVPPVPDEERDPLDDDTIPASKKKKTQDSRWGIYFQWTILILLIAFLACSIKIKFLNKGKFLGLEIWRWLALTVVLFCGRLISGWIMKLLEMLIEKQYILKKRVLYFVYGLRRSVKNCVWLALVLGVWESIFGGLEDTVAVHVLTKILWCLFTASISWMVKVLAVKVAANSFHRKAYFDRIQECIFNQYLLEVLSGPPTMAGIPDTGSSHDRFKKQSTRSEKKRHKNQSLKDKESGGQKPQKHPAPQMQRSRRLSRQISIDTPGYTTVEMGEFPSSSGSDVHTPSTRKVPITSQVPLIARSPIPIEQDKLQELTSDTVSVWTLRRLMKLIRNTNISTYSSIISQEKEEGEIGSEVQAKAAAKQVLMLTLFIVFFLIFGVETSKLLVFFSSVFLPSVFVFGNSARTTFESLIFLFVTHPFDVGDRVVVDGQNMLVEEMNVLNTIFLGPSNEKVYFPNSLLSMKAISNYYRSPDQGDAIEFQIIMSTPVEKLGILKERMQRYIESLPQFWYPDFRIVCDKIQDSNKMNMNIWMRHRLNFQDGGERFQRRSNMLMYLKQQLEDLGIGYHLPGQQITVTGIPFLPSPSVA